MRQEIIEFTGGLNVSTAPHNLPYNQTPSAQNFDLDGDGLKMRSARSEIAGSHPGVPAAVPRYAALVFGYDAIGLPQLIAYGGGYGVRPTTSHLSDPDVTLSTGGGWSNLTAEGMTSQSSGQYRAAAVGFIPTQGENAVVVGSAIVADYAYGQTAIDNGISSGDNRPSYITYGATAWAAVGDFGSFESYGRFPVFFDDRLLFFNTGSNATEPTSTQLRWSNRGSPLDFANGGFDRIYGMRGRGTGAIADKDRLVLLSTEEVWEARPRRDAYAFDIAVVDKSIGAPYWRTAALTDKGVMWLGKDLRFKLLVGNNVMSFNDDVQPLLVQDLREINHAWADFDRDTSTFRFYYSVTTGIYPTKGLWLRTDTIGADQADPQRLKGAWMPQSFNTTIANGAGPYSAGALTTAIYCWRSDQTRENSAAIDARWRTPSFRLRGADEKKTVTEVRLDYTSTSASSVSIYYTGDNGATVSSLGGLSLSSAVETAVLPVTTAAVRLPALELRSANSGKPKLTNLRILFRQYTGRF